MQDRLDRHEDLIGKLFSKVARLEADLREIYAIVNGMAEDTRRMWDTHLPELKDRITRIESGIDELKGLLPLVKNVKSLGGTIEQLHKRLVNVERLKDTLKARFDSQTEWRKNLGSVMVGAGLTGILYALVELLKWILR